MRDIGRAGRPGGNRERGFTLIEIIVTLAIATILGVVISGSMIYHQRLLMLQSERSDAQQNGRVAIEVLKRYIRQAGYGMDPRAIAGLVPIGTCNQTDPYACNDVGTHKSDLLRINAAKPGSFMIANGFWQPSQNSNARYGCKYVDCILKEGDHPSPHIPLPEIPRPQEGQLIVISGPCEDPVGITSDVYKIGDEKNSNPNDFYYAFDVIPMTSNCAKYDKDGMPEVYVGDFGLIDFYIDYSDAEHPSLMKGDCAPDEDLDECRASNRAVVVAHDIESLQLEYGIDSSATPDNIIDDDWCADPRASACTFHSNPTLGADPANHFRILAVRVAVVARTRQRSQTGGLGSAAMSVLGTTIPGGDGYSRWVFRATIDLRNRATKQPEASP